MYVKISLNFGTKDNEQSRLLIFQTKALRDVIMASAFWKLLVSQHHKSADHVLPSLRMCEVGGISLPHFPFPHCKPMNKVLGLSFKGVWINLGTEVR